MSNNYYIGLDIGGTKCAMTLGKIENGQIEVVEKEKFLTQNQPPEKILERFSAFIDEKLESHAIIWYGEDDWDDGENAVDANSFVNGSCTFEVDLTTFKSTENFTLMGNAAAFADLLVKVEAIQHEPTQNTDGTGKAPVPLCESSRQSLPGCLHRAAAHAALCKQSRRKSCW